MIRSMEECEDRISNNMQGGFFVLIPLGAFVVYHLSTVAYTHWKNFGKQEGQHAE